MSLDYQKHRPENANPTDSALAGTETWQVLIVDPDTAGCKRISDFFSTFSFNDKGTTVLCATDSDGARHILSQKNKPALLLWHLSPNNAESFYRILNTLRESKRQKDVQVVVLTDTEDIDEENRLFETGYIHAVCSPRDIATRYFRGLIRTLLGACHERRQLRQELEKKQLRESHLLESEQRLKEITDTIGDLIWEMDTRGNYTYISENVEEITGYQLAELNSIHFSAILNGSDASTAQKQITQCTAERRPFKNIEIWKKHRNGKQLCFLTNGRPVLDNTGRLLGYRGIDRDITEYKISLKENQQLINQLNQAQRLEALGTLAGGIAHDFNNILGVILGYAQLLQMEGSSESRTGRYSRNIIDGCNRAKNLTMQILDFSRIKDRDEPCQKPINPSSVIKEKLKVLRATIPASINIKSDIPQKTGNILVSPSELYQIITNLLTNAYQAMDGNQGSISVRMGTITLNAKNTPPTEELNLPHGEYVTLEVRDDGKGMPTELKHKIFEPYFTTKQGGYGKGFGLFMVHTIVTRCKGAVVLNSTPGKGTTITLFFPSVPEQEKINPDQPLSAAGTGRGRILFVDDEKMLVDLGKMMLERIGYEVLALQSSLDALAAVEKTPQAFDLVITDLTMPDLQGNKLAEKIKKIRPDLPVILSTGFDSRTAMAGGDREFIDAVLSKPLSINVLSEALQSLLPQPGES